MTQGEKMRGGQENSTLARETPRAKGDFGNATHCGEDTQALGDMKWIRPQSDQGQHWSRSFVPTEVINKLKLIFTFIKGTSGGPSWPSPQWAAYLCKIELVILPSEALSFVIVASSYYDIHSHHAQDEHVEDWWPHHLLRRQNRRALSKERNFAVKCN